LHEDTEHAVGPFAIAVLLVAAAGLGLAIVGLRGTGICAAALIVATQLLGYAIVSVSDGGSEFFVGLWLTLALAVAAGAVLLGAEISTRRRAGASVWWLVALAVAVVLPPLGLVVVAIVWLLALAVRAASRALQRSQVA
jgi:hypothetical protein